MSAIVDEHSAPTNEIIKSSIGTTPATMTVYVRVCVRVLNVGGGCVFRLYTHVSVVLRIVVKNRWTRVSRRRRNMQSQRRQFMHI